MSADARWQMGAAACAVLVLLGAGPTARAQPEACEPATGKPGSESDAELARTDRLVAAFEKRFPKALRSKTGAERASLTPSVLDALVRELACLASLPGGDPFVPETATTLFASKRHGRAAFAILDRMAADAAASLARREAARAFAVQMGAYVENAGRGNG